MRTSDERLSYNLSSIALATSLSAARPFSIKVAFTPGQPEGIRSSTVPAIREDRALVRAIMAEESERAEQRA